MGQINGHARPIVGAGGPIADHTNVTCTGAQGNLWVCCGVPPAGPIICTGPGSTQQADCLSTPAVTPKFNDTAGLLYAVTGVCHQAANRVLFAANLLINNKCRGIKASVATYGLRGKSIPAIRARLAMKLRFNALMIFNGLVKAAGAVDWVNKLNNCVNVVGDLPPCLPPLGGQPPVTPASDFEQDYLDAMNGLYEGGTLIPDDDLHHDALTLQLTQGLDASKTEALRVPILKLLSHNLDVQADVVADFLEGVIDTQTFVESTNKLAVDLQAQILDVLGPDQYVRTMDAQPGEFYWVVDPSIALEGYGDRFSIDQFQ